MIPLPLERELWQPEIIGIPHRLRRVLFSDVWLLVGDDTIQVFTHHWPAIGPGDGLQRWDATVVAAILKNHAPPFTCLGLDNATLMKSPFHLAVEIGIA